MDNAAARALHNARAQQWIEDIRAAKAAQSERDVLVLPPTPTGHVPELQLEEGRFKAYRFRSLKEETAWIPDSGSSRIDAVLERHFAQGDLS